MLAAVSIAAIAAVNVLATGLVVRDRLAETRHKIFQVAAVWLIPIAGAVLAFGIHRKTEKSSGNYPPDPDSGHGIEDSRLVGRALRSAADDD
jgi:hypothetical protein